MGFRGIMEGSMVTLQDITLGQIKKYTRLYTDKSGSSLAFLMGTETNRDTRHDGVNHDGLQKKGE